MIQNQIDHHLIVIIIKKGKPNWKKPTKVETISKQGNENFDTSTPSFFPPMFNPFNLP